MKILYAIQGTGNGHISRAREIIPNLMQHGDTDLLISGTQSNVQLPYLIRYKKRGISFTFGKRGDIDLIDTVKQFRPLTFVKDVWQFPVQDYDLIINDFEPLTAWACKLRNKPCIALSHQAAYLSDRSPRPLQKDVFAEGVFKHYAPSTHHIGFHFDSFDQFIHRPVIRKEIRQQETANHGHITVYLPAHSDTTVVKHLSIIKEVKWEVFSKHSKGAYRVGNVHIRPIHNEQFTQSLATSNGLLTAGGFEGPAEAIFLGKKVFSIPMSNQYEQLCNAEAMKKIGVTVSPKLNREMLQQLMNWVHFGQPIKIAYPDCTEKIIGELVARYGTHTFDHTSPQIAW